MSAKPLVTVLITAYNSNVSYLNQAVKSAINQDYSNLEILLIDDGSTPKLDKLLEDRKHPKLRYKFIEHNGLPFGLIKGIQEANGKYIAILDHDDILTEDSIGKRVEKIEKEKVGLIYGDLDFIDGDNKVYSCRRFKDYPSIGNFVNALLSNIVTPLKHIGVMFNKEAIIKSGNYDSSLLFYFDIDLIIRVAKDHGFAHLPEVVAKYRTHGKNTSSKNRLYGLKYKLKVVNKQIEKPSKNYTLKTKVIINEFAKKIYELFSIKKNQFLFDILSNVSMKDIIYTKKSIGKDFKPIKIYKIRTMYKNAEYDVNHSKEVINQNGKPSKDPRILSWGSFFRRNWIDEIPQIYNLLKRDIKLVGIRPKTKLSWDYYPKELMEETLKYRPGLFGFQYASREEGDFDLHIKNMKIYLEEYKRNPIGTDIKYITKILTNILFKGLRSS